MKFRLFQALTSHEILSFLFTGLISGRKNPLAIFFQAPFSLSCFLLWFSFVFFDFLIQEPVVFIDIPANCI